MFVIWRVFEFDYYLIVIFTKELYGTINTINLLYFINVKNTSIPGIRCW